MDRAGRIAFPDDGGDVFAFRRYCDVVEYVAFKQHIERPAQKRPSGQINDVFSRQALGAHSGRHHGSDIHYSLFPRWPGKKMTVPGQALLDFLHIGVVGENGPVGPMGH